MPNVSIVAGADCTSKVDCFRIMDLDSLSIGLGLDKGTILKQLHRYLVTKSI